MEITFEDFCNKVKEDTEKTMSKSDQYKAAVDYFNKVHEAGNIVLHNESFTSFQNGVLDFLNILFESHFEYPLESLFETKRDSDFRYGYNYARKVHCRTQPVNAVEESNLGIVDED